VFSSKNIPQPLSQLRRVLRTVVSLIVAIPSPAMAHINAINPFVGDQPPAEALLAKCWFGSNMPSICGIKVNQGSDMTTISIWYPAARQSAMTCTFTTESLSSGSILTNSCEDPAYACKTIYRVKSYNGKSLRWTSQTMCPGNHVNEAGFTLF